MDIILVVFFSYLSGSIPFGLILTKIFTNKDIRKIGTCDGSLVIIGNMRGEVIIHTEEFSGLQEGIIIVEGIWPNEAFAGQNGINTLIGSDPVPPNGGAAFHDAAVWIKLIWVGATKLVSKVFKKMAVT